ncbi:multidrug ABC transporter permease [Sphingorhabdus lutea]|uniref:Multidrug ABC transporter permease n=2 Tax=Sphingorhabdus lutea TaxID=1913578 RepID=A0A1L3JEG3_9SPHN|nr:multidrug ABC transporter permease [Sphingorhabdus lutea]
MPNDDQQQDDKPTRPWLRPILIILAILAVGFGAYEYWQYRVFGQYQQSTNDAVISADDVAISSKLAGFIEFVKISENASVEEGALLLQIRASDYASQVDAADSQILLARANGAVTQSNIAEAQAAVAAATSELAKTQARMRYIDQQIARYRPLVNAGAEPSTKLDELNNERAQTSADLGAKQAAIAQAQQRISSLRAQTGATKAQVRAAEVEKQRANINMADTRLSAPIAGRIGSLEARAGQYVSPGQRLMTIVPTQNIYVTANFKETQIGMMRIGQPVTIKVDAISGVEFRGTVETISPGTGANFSLIPPQNATGNFTKIVQRVPVRIKLEAGPESRQLLLPGLSLEVSVDTRSARAEIEAIKRKQAGK